MDFQCLLIAYNLFYFLDLWGFNKVCNKIKTSHIAKRLEEIRIRIKNAFILCKKYDLFHQSSQFPIHKVEVVLSNWELKIPLLTVFDLSISNF